VADALTHITYWIAIQLPCRILHNTVLDVPPHMTVLRAGNIAHRVLQRPCNTAVVHRLKELSEHANAVVAESAKLTSYLAAQQLLTSLPGSADLYTNYTPFNKQGQLIVADHTTADALLAQLSQYMDRLHMAEQLYPGWTTHGLYNKVSTLLTTHFVEQGRALANSYTREIVSEIRQHWQAGKIARGLTLFIPYLDERRCRMEKYKVVVIPTGRILFRPEFIIGACRVSQHHVRKDPELSQATRWQLLSQLDSIIQAFETELRLLR